MTLKAFMMYLDPEDPEDAAIIKYLNPKVKRRKVSGEMREAMLMRIHMQKRTVSGAITGEWEPEAKEPKQDNLPRTVNEAANTFLKRR